jgi:hypothetical protein
MILVPAEIGMAQASWVLSEKKNPWPLFGVKAARTSGITHSEVDPLASVKGSELPDPEKDPIV